MSHWQFSLSLSDWPIIEPLCKDWEVSAVVSLVGFLAHGAQGNLCQNSSRTQVKEQRLQ